MASPFISCDATEISGIIVASTACHQQEGSNQTNGEPPPHVNPLRPDLHGTHFGT